MGYSRSEWHARPRGHVLHTSAITHITLQHSLFSLNCLALRYIVAGDVSFSEGVKTSSLPPVTISVIQYLQTFPFGETQVFTCSLVIVEQGDENRPLGDV